jgi:predicted RNA-binding Zn-ribbon protein involved in translation (DUF1610 family)
MLTTALWLFSPAAVSQSFIYVISVLSVAWATAFSAFECVLITKNRKLSDRIFFIENNWSYALGYGFWLSIVYHCLPSPIALTLWQYGLLMLMMHAMRLQVRPDYSRTKLRIFYWSQKIASVVISVTMSILNRINGQPKNNNGPGPTLSVTANRPKFLRCNAWNCPKGYETIMDTFAARIGDIEGQNPNSIRERIFCINFDYIGFDCNSPPCLIIVLDESSILASSNTNAIKKQVQAAIDAAKRLAVFICCNCGEALLDDSRCNKCQKK